jgi:hypothetical protein
VSNRERLNMTKGQFRRFVRPVVSMPVRETMVQWRLPRALRTVSDLLSEH